MEVGDIMGHAHTPVFPFANRNSQDYTRTFPPDFTERQLQIIRGADPAAVRKRGPALLLKEAHFHDMEDIAESVYDR